MIVLSFGHMSVQAEEISGAGFIFLMPCMCFIQHFGFISNHAHVLSDFSVSDSGKF